VRNPPWSREELILALDLYLRHIPTGPSDPEVLALSELLNRLPIHRDRPDAQRFRNPNGVYMKLQNFRRLDPDYPGTGLTRGSKLEEEIWREFVGEPRLLRERAREIEHSARHVSRVAERRPAADDGRLARLDTDIAQAFPTDQAVNDTLRSLLKIARRISAEFLPA
jgi:hypothetical protein